MGANTRVYVRITESVTYIVMQGSAEPHPLASQVGGHQGVTTSDDDSIVMKPALPTEVAFYQALNSDPVLAPLRPFVPQFFGTLRLEGQLIKLDGDIEEKNIRPTHDKPDKIVFKPHVDIFADDDQHSLLF